MSSSQSRHSTDEIESELAELRHGVRERHAALLGLTSTFASTELQWRQLAAVRARASVTAAQAEAAERVKQIEARAADTQAAAIRRATAAAAELAPRFLSASWSAPAWKSQTVDLRYKSCSWIRVGVLDVAPSVPALLPLVNHAGWAVRASADDFNDLVQGLLLRLSSSIPLHRLEVRVFDPLLGSFLGPFTAFREVSERSLAPATGRIGEFESMLDQAVDGIGATAEAIGASGSDSLDEHWRSSGTLDLTYRLLIVGDYPRSATPAAQDKLVQIARTAGRQGASLLVRVDRESAPRRDLDPSELLDLLTPVDLTGGVISARSLPNSVVHFDGPPPRSVVERAVGAIVAANRDAAAPTTLLETLLERIPGQWSNAEWDGLNAWYGTTNRKPLALRLRTENPPLPNALVGGAVGQGKSNLLLAIIYSLAARYRPDDLRLFLLDFREGVEFSSLGPDADGQGWLPHAEVLGLESDRAFGVAVLEYLVTEMKERALKMTKAGARSIVDFRRDHGGRMPRIVLVIDEFQVLFDGEGPLTDRAVGAFEALARQGRGFGIHMVVASQTVSGVRGLAVKGEAIFGQFPNRLSLKNTARESEAILGPHNTAAARLAFRGEIVHNENSGAPESNQQGIVAYAEPDHLKRLRRHLWQRARASQPPRMFFGARPSRWDSATLEELAHVRRAANRSAGRYRLWLGRPVAVDPAPVTVEMTRDADQALALVGSGESEGTGVTTSLLTSLAMQSRPGNVWVVLDGTSSASAGPAAWLDRLLRLGRAHGNTVHYVAREKINAYLAEEGRELTRSREDDGSDTFVILIAPQMIKGLDEPVPGQRSSPSGTVAVDDAFRGLEAFEDQFDEAVVPADVLRELVQSGSQTGVFTIGWWSNRRKLEEHLGYDTPGVAAHVLFNLGRDDLSSLLGPSFPNPEGAPRVVIRDGRTRPEVQTAIPFDAISHEALALLEAK